MANETIVSPGVFTRENDQSFLPQGIGQIGAAIVGPTVQGPAFVPIVIRNGFSEFERRFGPLSKTTYVPQTVREYLRSAGSVTVCRVLAGGGYKFDGVDRQLAALVTTGSSFSELTTTHPSNAVTASAGSKGIEAAGALFTTQLQVGDTIRINPASQMGGGVSGTGTATLVAGDLVGDTISIARFNKILQDGLPQDQKILNAAGLAEAGDQGNENTTIGFSISASLS